MKIIKEDKLNSDYYYLDVNILNGSVSPTLALSCLFIQSFLSTATFQRLKPGVHIVVRVEEHVCDDVSKKILKPSTYQLQIFLVRDQYLRSLLPHGDHVIAGQLEEHVPKPKLAILTTYMETRLYIVILKV